MKGKLEAPAPVSMSRSLVKFSDHAFNGHFFAASQLFEQGEVRMKKLFAQPGRIRLPIPAKDLLEIVILRGADPFELLVQPDVWVHVPFKVDSVENLPEVFANDAVHESHDCGSNSGLFKVTGEGYCPNSGVEFGKCPDSTPEVSGFQRGLLVPFPLRPTISLNCRVPGCNVVRGSCGNAGTSLGSIAAAISSPTVQIWSVMPSAIAGVQCSVSWTRHKL